MHVYEPCGRNLGLLAGELGENGQLLEGLEGQKVQGKEGREQVGLGSAGPQGSNSHPTGPRLAGGEEGPLFLLS